MELAKRVANYKQDIAKKKTRPVISNISKFGHFSLTIYLVELVQLEEMKDASLTLLRKLVILEQYLILTLKPSLNTVKVANTAPYTDHSELSPEGRNKMVTSMSQPIYLYLDDVLVFEAASAAVGARQLGIGVVSFFRNMKDGTKLFRRYTVSRVGPTENTKVALIPIDALKKLFEGYRVESGLNKHSMQVLIKDTINNTEYTAPSIATASTFTYNTDGRSISVKTLRKWLDSGKIVKGWIFSQVKLVILVRGEPILCPLSPSPNKIFYFYYPLFISNYVIMGAYKISEIFYKALVYYLEYFIVRCAYFQLLLIKYRIYFITVMV